MRLDPRGDTGDGRDNEQISGNQFSLNIEGCAENISEDDGCEGEEADQSFHCGYI